MDTAGAILTMDGDILITEVTGPDTIMATGMLTMVMVITRIITIMAIHTMTITRVMADGNRAADITV